MRRYIDELILIHELIAVREMFAFGTHQEPGIVQLSQLSQRYSKPMLSNNSIINGDSVFPLLNPGNELSDLCIRKHCDTMLNE